MRLDEKGRCCGCKPIHYKGGSWRSPNHPMKFCSRCCREFDPEGGEQRENWAWKLDPNNEWKRTVYDPVTAQHRVPTEALPIPSTETPTQGEK